MSAKGNKLSKESKNKISKANKRFHEKRASLELSIEGNRVYIRSLTNSAISVKVDITPVWHFFKETIAFQEFKAKGGKDEDFFLAQ